MQFPAFTRSIRFRLTVWYSSLLLVFGVAFVLALNIAVRLDQPGTIYEGVQYNDIEWQPVRTGPGQAITGFVPRLRENVTPAKPKTRSTPKTSTGSGTCRS